MTFSLQRYAGSLFFFALGLFGLSILYVALIKPPHTFSPHELVLIEEGETGGGAALRLKNEGLIQSRTAFKIFLTLFGGSHGLVAGDYDFEYPSSVAYVAWRMSRGIYGLQSVRVTIPEGQNMREIAALFDERLSRFNSDIFIDIASTSEGYLFPDTYFVLPNATEKEVFKMLKNGFDKRIRDVETLIRGFGRPLSDIIVMASLLEEEARTELTRQMIAGILWKRLDDDMPLQVDAVFAYVDDKNTFELTTEDLRKDHPYNTYTRKGLPPTPISNPGLDTIRAALMPIDSPYYYYLSDMNGEMHYAETHDEHVANKDKYLR